jgi:hypothetical protein
MPTPALFYDCQLDIHPLIRVAADSPEAAKTKYFRLYAISSSTAEWHCKAVAASVDGSLPPAPVEPESWVKRRKELGTWSEAGATDQPLPTKASDTVSASPTKSKKDSASP